MIREWIHSTDDENKVAARAIFFVFGLIAIVSLGMWFIIALFTVLSWSLKILLLSIVIGAFLAWLLND